ncbi:MAG: hypothetical protein Kow0069_13000 [Promethearchaeota archaeon]
MLPGQDFSRAAASLIRMTGEAAKKGRGERSGRLFKLVSPHVPSGDQPDAIEELVSELEAGQKFVTLLGATGTGKTFTIAHVIQRLQRPTLVIAPNKTLAAQLFQEFQELFPENAVRYFVSYYDYYQPEAYMPASGQYIEKDFSINDEIDKMRLASAQALVTRRDVIIVATVSCIYGLGDPAQWKATSIEVKVGDVVDRQALLRQLVDSKYERNDVDFRRGTVRVRGDVIDVYPGYLDTAIRLELFGDEVDRISEIDPLTGTRIAELTNCRIFPARHFVIPEEYKLAALESIEEEMRERVKWFKARKKYAEAQRIEQRTKFDLEMMREVGYCHGIENYSRHLDRRAPGTPPMTLIEYFPPDFLVVIDESHVTIPQIGGMIHGDRSRKKNLVDYGFRLPSAYDNRPLTWEEFLARVNQCVMMSATPGDFEMKHSRKVVDQVIRPTGLLDPRVELRPTTNQIDDLLAEIRATVAKGYRVLVTTLTKRLAENVTEYYADAGVRVRYLHSEIDTIERSELLRGLRMGQFDVLVGINLLREGLDLPEVALVAILDADKEGFLRDKRSLIQTIGRAARNIEGRVIMYADKMTDAIKGAVAETERRRRKQEAYNLAHGIVPETIKKAVQTSLSEERARREEELEAFDRALRQRFEGGDVADAEEMVRVLEQEMRRAAQELKFEEAAMLRDKIQEIRAEMGAASPGGATAKKKKLPPGVPKGSGPRLTTGRRSSPDATGSVNGARVRFKVGLRVLPPRVLVGVRRRENYSNSPKTLAWLFDALAKLGVVTTGKVELRLLDDPRLVGPDETRYEAFAEVDPGAVLGDSSDSAFAEEGLELRRSRDVEVASLQVEGADVQRAYQALFRWVQRRRFVVDGPVAEVYGVDGDGPLAQPEELRVPVRRKPRKLERAVVD